MGRDTCECGVGAGVSACQLEATSDIARVTVLIGCDGSWSGAIAAEPAGDRGGVYIGVTQIADDSVVLALTPNNMTNIVIMSFQL